MTRKIPVLPTLMVLLAVGIMVRLGLWQLDRRAEKDALLAHYAAAQGMSAEVAWGARGVDDSLFYRRAHLTCTAVISHSGMSGHNARDESGYAQTAQCALPGGGRALVVLGWSVRPDAGPAWDGGEVRGVIAPGPRLVADPPLGGLEANAIPDPAELPNNHLSYAVQWFLFAATALVIYAVALRRRMRG